MNLHTMKMKYMSFDIALNARWNDLRHNDGNWIVNIFFCHRLPQKQHSWFRQQSLRSKNWKQTNLMLIHKMMCQSVASKYHNKNNNNCPPSRNIRVLRFVKIESASWVRFTSYSLRPNTNQTFDQTFWLKMFEMAIKAFFLFRIWLNTCVFHKHTKSTVVIPMMISKITLTFTSWCTFLTTNDDLFNGAHHSV